MKHDTKEKLFVMRLIQIICIVIAMQILFTGCSSKFVVDTNFDIDEDLDVSKVVFLFDNSDSSKKAKPFFAELREKYKDKVKFYFIDAKSKEAEPVLEKYSLDTSSEFPQIRMCDAGERDFVSIHGFSEMNKPSIEDYILKMIRIATVPEGLGGKWEVVNTETKKNETGIDALYAIAYKIIANVGDNIRFVDGKRIQFGHFAMEYELTEENVLLLQRENATSLIFDLQINGDTLIFENDYYKIEAQKVE